MAGFPESSLPERLIALMAAVALGVDPILVHEGVLTTGVGAYVGAVLGAVVSSFHATAALAQARQGAAQAATGIESVLSPQNPPAPPEPPPPPTAAVTHVTTRRSDTA